MSSKEPGSIEHEEYLNYYSRISRLREIPLSGVRNQQVAQRIVEKNR